MECFDLIHYLQVGNLGKNRDKFLGKVGKQAGRGNWFWAFRCKAKLYSWELGMQMYEDAYWNFLRNDISSIKELISKHNVFVHDRHDIDSLFNYKHQTSHSDHYSDIAIRRCLIRMGVWFQGSDIFDLKDTKFIDSNVSFHLPHLIEGDNKSALSWLNENRYIVIAKETEDKCKLSEIMVK